MVFVLYRINNSGFRIIATYETEEDALIDKNDIVIDTQDENSKYYVTDVVYYKDTQKEQTSMNYSEEDCNIDEEEYYNLVAKTKDQAEEIEILSEELAFLKKRYSSIVREYSNDSLNTYRALMSILVLFMLCMIYFP
jgi:hypothetical protein